MEKKNLHTVNVNHDGQAEQALRLTHGVSLLEGLLKAQVDINHSCGGNASCGTCLVEILQDVEGLPERNELELEMAMDRGFRADERLACQLEVLKELKIRIP